MLAVGHKSLQFEIRSMNNTYQIRNEVMKWDYGVEVSCCLANEWNTKCQSDSISAQKSNSLQLIEAEMLRTVELEGEAVRLPGSERQ